MRKKNLLALVLALGLAIILGCMDKDEPIIKQEIHPSNTSLSDFKSILDEASYDDKVAAYYGVIEIDSIEYVVVIKNGYGGVALCPKVYK